MGKIDLLIVGAPVAILSGFFLKTGDWHYLMVPVAILLVQPVIFWRRHVDRQARQDEDHPMSEGFEPGAGKVT